MKSRLISGVVACAALLCTSCNNYDTLIFEDNFDKDGIPDQEVWSLCRKGNAEWCNEMSESYDQAYCEDGKLILIAEKKGDTYLAGGIESKGKFDFTFGRMEVRARMTDLPDGAFPAIWLMPAKNGETYDLGWPNGGEIDVMEHIRQEDGIYHTLHSNYTYNLKIKDPINTAYVKCDFQDWIVYSVEWNEDKIKFYIDGKKTFSYKNLHLENEAEMRQWPFTAETAMYPILNMGLGGNPDGWPGAIDDEHLPARMEIDWIRIYQ